MAINQLKFIKICSEKFIDKNPELPKIVLEDIIMTVLIDAPGMYFSYDMVQEHPEFCKKCGSCCKQREQPCEYFNGRTCDDYYARWDMCAEWPYYSINGEEGLMLDPGCQFALKLAEMQLEKEIAKNKKLLLGDINDGK